MIELINESFKPDSFEYKDIFSVKILSLLKAYGTKYPFVRFYAQKNDEGTVTAILSVLDGDITLSFALSLADTDELREFISVIGFNTLLCNGLFKFNAKFESGVIMESSKKAEFMCNYTEVDEYPYLFDLYNFVDYDGIDFESWYVDINHRIRHNCAKAVTLNINDEIISSAILSSIYNNDAVITAVQTKPEFRNSGYGSALVSAMCCDVKGTVYLMREENKNENFYKRLGFINTGHWRIYK